MSVKTIVTVPVGIAGASAIVQSNVGSPVARLGS
jgi:hypothetical protein